MGENPKGEVVWISAASASQLGEWARDGAPDEVCGLLFGPTEGAFRVTGVARVANLRAGAAFELDPGEWVAAEDVAAGRGLVRCGFWHSHPSGDIRPSSRDAAAAWEGSLHLIASPHGEVAAYVFEGGRFRDRRVRPLPQGPR